MRGTALATNNTIDNCQSLSVSFKDFLKQVFAFDNVNDKTVAMAYDVY